MITKYDQPIDESMLAMDTLSVACSTNVRTLNCLKTQEKRPISLKNVHILYFEKTHFILIFVCVNNPMRPRISIE